MLLAAVHQDIDRMLDALSSDDLASRSEARTLLLSGDAIRYLPRLHEARKTSTGDAANVIDNAIVYYSAFKLLDGAGGVYCPASGHYTQCRAERAAPAFVYAHVVCTWSSTTVSVRSAFTGKELAKRRFDSAVISAAGSGGRLWVFSADKALGLNFRLEEEVSAPIKDPLVRWRQFGSYAFGMGDSAGYLVRLASGVSAKVGGELKALAEHGPWLITIEGKRLVLREKDTLLERASDAIHRLYDHIDLNASSAGIVVSGYSNDCRWYEIRNEDLRLVEESAAANILYKDAWLTMTCDRLEHYQLAGTNIRKSIGKWHAIFTISERRCLFFYEVGVNRICMAIGGEVIDCDIPFSPTLAVDAVEIYGEDVYVPIRDGAKLCIVRISRYKNTAMRAIATIAVN